MGRRSIGILFLVLLIVLFIGCEEAKVYTYSDFLGEWTLPNVSQLSIMEDSTDPTQKILDIRWKEGLIEYFAMIGGTESGNVITGSYTYNETTYVDENDTTGSTVYYGDPKKSITIKLTMYQDKPKVTCTGEGPLAGKTFSK